MHLNKDMNYNLDTIFLVYLDLIIMNLDQLVQEYKVPMVGDIKSLKQKNLK